MNAAVLSFKTTLRQRLTRWRTIAGLDFHVLVTLLLRGRGVIAGRATIFLLPLWLSPTEQGYYFTFGSVLALQISFERGVNQIVMQLVRREVAHLAEMAGGRLTCNELHLGRLSSLARLIRSWYGVSAVLIGVLGGIAGIIFVSAKWTGSMSVWLGACVVFVGSTAVNLWLSPGLAVIEGCCKVGQVACFRLVQSVIGYACLWAALMSGSCLWVEIAGTVVSAVCTRYYFRAHGNIATRLYRQTTLRRNRKPIFIGALN